MVTKAKTRELYHDLRENKKEYEKSLARATKLDTILQRLCEVNS